MSGRTDTDASLEACINYLVSCENVSLAYAKKIATEALDDVLA
jgi:hypothetical protein